MEAFGVVLIPGYERKGAARPGSLPISCGKMADVGRLK